MTGDVNTPPEQTSYRCEAIAEELGHGTDETVRYTLGTFRTISPVLALRWLGGQALWIVDRLGRDPRPGHLGELLAWYDDRESQRAAHAHIKTGAPLLVVIPDADWTYTLSLRSVGGGSRSPHRPPGGCAGTSSWSPGSTTSPPARSGTI